MAEWSRAGYIAAAAASFNRVLTQHTNIRAPHAILLTLVIFRMCFLFGKSEYKRDFRVVLLPLQGIFRFSFLVRLLFVGSSLAITNIARVLFGNDGSYALTTNPQSAIELRWMCLPYHP